MATKLKPDRRLTVLGTLVKMFVKSGEPVASSQLVREGGLDCSSATVRNIMVQLTEEGLLHQPHASAGRVPTDEGFRLFVRDLMEPADVESRDRQLIESGLSDAGSFRDCLPQGSRLAAFFSNHAGVVLTPPPRVERLSRFEFLRLKRNEIVAILVTESGDVRHRHIVSAEDHDAPEIERYNNFLNSLLHGLTLPELRDCVEHELKKARDEYDRLRTGALTLAGQTLPEMDAGGSAGRLIIEGMRSLLSAPELSNDETRLRSALELMEERERLAKLLDRVMRSTGGRLAGGRAAALIGSETGIESFPVALVVAGYGPEGGQPLGMIGVLGTTRLDYERIVPIVGYLASRLSRAAGDAGLA